MQDDLEERKTEAKRDKYKFAFVFTAATLAVCIALLILLLVNRSSRSKITVINYNAETVSATEAAERTSVYKKTNDMFSVSDGRIDLNSCSAEQLCSIPGVGEKTAAKIIEYRESVGGFGSVDELINVKGIGEVKLEKIRKYVTVVN